MMTPATLRRRGGILALGAIVAAGLAAPWIAPHDPDLMEDVAGARYLGPLTSAWALQSDPQRIWIVTSLKRTPAGWSFQRAGRNVEIAAAAMLRTPERRLYLLGTDALGRDLASRLLFGARRTLWITSICVALSLILGVGIGAASGLAGGWWDTIMMRGVDILMSIPRLVILMVCAALLRPSDLTLILVLAATTWTGLARIVRAEILALGRGEMVLAARAAGASPLRLLAAHMVPSLAPILAVTASLRFADTVLLESALAFLGIATPASAVSLGAVISSARDGLGEASWVVAAPGLLITVLVITVRSTVASLFRLPDPPSVS